jgi:hypothetical protein
VRTRRFAASAALSIAAGALAPVAAHADTLPTTLYVSKSSSACSDAGTPGLTIANGAQVSAGTGGAVDFANGGSSAGSTQLIVDVFGYYASS